MSFIASLVAFLIVWFVGMDHFNQPPIFSGHWWLVLVLAALVQFVVRTFTSTR